MAPNVNNSNEIMAEVMPDIPAGFQDIKTNEKADESFRVYTSTDSPSRVVDHYTDMRRFQTVDFYKKMENKYDFSNGKYRRKMTILEAFAELENYVDASDPDLDLPNLLHLLQTAEGMKFREINGSLSLSALMSWNIFTNTIFLLSLNRHQTRRSP